MRVDALVRNIHQLVSPAGTGAARGRGMRELTIVDDAAIAITAGRIAWVGRQRDWDGVAGEEIDARGRAVIPALVDPHTHAIWAGDRLDDFDARTAGATYQQILARGGGIHHTIGATAGVDAPQLAALAQPRIEALMRGGAATIEVKSGYGFTAAAELRSLEAIRLLAASVPARICATLLIHVPPRDPGARDDYLAAVVHDLIPGAAARSLASTVDVFIEREAFTAEEARGIFAAARDHGLQIKAHADQFHAIGGVAAALDFGALSVDHLEAASDDDIAALASGRTVAVVLPGVTLHLGIPAAPGRALVDAGAAVAIGTDLNPGSSPLFSPQFALALAVRLNGLTAAEALTGATANAAAALGLSDAGRLDVGQRADFLITGSSDWRDVAYILGGDPIDHRYIEGKEVLP